jgi:hypothetical protein
MIQSRIRVTAMSARALRSRPSDSSPNSSPSDTNRHRVKLHPIKVRIEARDESSRERIAKATTKTKTLNKEKTTTKALTPTAVS